MIPFQNSFPEIAPRQRPIRHLGKKLFHQVETQFTQIDTKILYRRSPHLLPHPPMALFIVATPIGNPGDFSERARATLKGADVVIGEEGKMARRLLKQAGALPKEIHLLNEHSDADDVNHLAEMCLTKNVALISDCGTPGFSDPGPRLVERCRSLGVAVSPVPGASSLTTLLSVSSQPLRQFLFVGFLPANMEQRKVALKKLKSEQKAMILMDTPYRLTRLLAEVALTFKGRRALLGLDMTKENEVYLEDRIENLEKLIPREKAEFMLLIYEDTKCHQK